MTGACDSLLLSARPVSTSPIYTGPIPGTPSVITNGRSFTFGVAPSVGDYLVAFSTYINGGGSSYPGLTTGWVSILQANGGAAGLPRQAAYFQVVTGGVTSYTPFTDGGTALDSTAIFDVGPVSGVFSGVDGVASGQGPSSTTITSSANNTLVLAFSWEFANGGPAYSAPTVTGPVTGLVTASTPVLSASYGTIVVNGGSITQGVQGNWTGGAGSSNTGGMLVSVR